MEHKTFPGIVTKADGDQGVVRAVFALFGNVDETRDILHPGAFAKTFFERGRKVRVLDAHKTDSIMRVLGKPLSLREVGREELPTELKAQYPAVTGGAEAEIQFLMDTPEGKGAFIRLKEHAIDEWSFGYDPLDTDNSRVIKDGEEVTVRNLRTVKLYEISPVLWGANPATTTLSAKDAKPAPDVTENTIRIRTRDPGDFQAGSFRTITIGDEDQGIQATIGKLEGEDNTTVQAYVFDKDKWTPARAQAWVDEHEGGGKALTEEDAPELPTPEQGQSFTCECVDCGYVETSTEHCRDLTCPKCGGQMRRAERPGPGKGEEETMDEQKGITDEDKNVLNRELRSLNMTDLVATHRRLHQFAAQGNILGGFSRADMNWFHTTVEKELRRRAEDNDREPPEATPLEWGSGKAGDEEIEGDEEPEDDEEKHLPSRIGIIRRRYEEEQGKAGDGPDEAKYGRAISGRNAERLIGAVTTIADVLEASGYDIPGYDRVPAPISPPEPEEDEGKSADVSTETSDTAPAAEEAQGANEDQQEQKRAGPSEEAPTPAEGAGPPESEAPTQQVDARLARIRVTQSQLNLLEV